MGGLPPCFGGLIYFTSVKSLVACESVYIWSDFKQNMDFESGKKKKNKYKNPLDLVDLLSVIKKNTCKKLLDLLSWSDIIRTESTVVVDSLTQNKEKKNEYTK